MKSFLANAPLLAVLVGVLLLFARPAAAGENEPSPQDVGTLTALIQSRGYNCPLAKRFINLGPNAYGHAIQILCGPVDTDKDDLFASFRLTKHPNGRFSLTPCSILFCTADD